MSVFSDEELAYLAEQLHGRLATVDASGQPHVVPVAFRVDERLGVIDVGGPALSQTKKFRDARSTGRAAFVVDDLLPPWRPRGIEVRGEARVLPEGGYEIHEGFEPAVIRILPRRIAVWVIEDAGARSSRTVSPEAEPGQGT